MSIYTSSVRRCLVSPAPEGAFTITITWVESWVTVDKIRTEVEKCGFGTPIKVDFVEVDTKHKHSKVYIHFSSVVADVKAHLDGDKKLKVFYNGNYFWKL